MMCHTGKYVFAQYVCIRKGNKYLLTGIILNIKRNLWVVIKRDGKFMAFENLGSTNSFFMRLH